MMVLGAVGIHCGKRLEQVFERTAIGLIFRGSVERYQLADDDLNQKPLCHPQVIHHVKTQTPLFKPANAIQR
jgi:hypothetical protein